VWLGGLLGAIIVRLVWLVRLPGQAWWAAGCHVIAATSLLPRHRCHVAAATCLGGVRVDCGLQVLVSTSSQ
jgi:hypothetical protein